MPANLPPQYLAAEERFRSATDTEEKIEALQEMIALLPKHKGTDHLFADLKRKLSRLKKEPQKKGGARQREFYHIEVEGAGQVVFAGSPNCGKSSILKSLTNAEPEIADYPFTTRKPLPGMMQYQDIQVQLIDLPPIVKDMVESWVFFIIRNSNACLLCVDSSSDECLENIEDVTSILKEKKIILSKGEEKEENPRERKIPSILLCLKKDIPKSEENIKILEEFYSEKFRIIKVSIFDRESLEKLKEEIFKILNIVRVYSKIPGKPPDLKAPYITKRGTIVYEFSEKIHKDFKSRFNFAKVWNEKGVKGLRVARDYILQDRDIIEIHTF